MADYDRLADKYRALESERDALAATLERVRGELDAALSGEHGERTRAEVAERRFEELEAELHTLWQEMSNHGTWGLSGEDVAERIDAILEALPSHPTPAPARWTGAPGLPERDVLARSAAEYAQIIVESDARIAELEELLDRECSESMGYATERAEWRERTEAAESRVRELEAELAHITELLDQANAALERPSPRDITPHQRAALDACAAAMLTESKLTGPNMTVASSRRIARAELARRAAEGEKP